VKSVQPRPLTVEPDTWHRRRKKPMECLRHSTHGYTQLDKLDIGGGQVGEYRIRLNL